MNTEHETHDAHGHGAHNDEPEVETPNPQPPLSAFIWPGLIALLVLLLLLGHIVPAFSPYSGG